MARMEFSGTEELMDQLFAEADRVEQKAGKMLEEAGKVMVGAWKDAITEAGHAPPGRSRRGKGDLIGSIRADAPKKKGDTHQTAIYPRGKNRKGQRNAEVAFVLHYGRSGMPGDHFVDTAEENAGDAVQTVMEQVWNEN